MGGTEEKYFASWNTIELAYDIDSTTINNIKKQMPKLHDGHIRIYKIRKMEVNLAVQILSRTVSSFVRHLTCITGLYFFSEYYISISHERKK